MARNENKILVIGGTGYIGSYIVKASIKLGHPTYVYSRPNSSKTELLQEFESLGVIIVKGDLADLDKLVSIVKEVDVVISAVAFPQVFDQLKIIEAIKIAGGVKRFIPSDFGCEEDRISVLPPFQAFLDKKKRIRRAIEEANIPHTYVSASGCSAYFINYLLHPHDQQTEEITVYGTGHAKAVLNFEEDVGIYTIKVATDERTSNRHVVIRPSTNIISQLQLISLWEKKTGRTFKRVHVLEEEIVSLSETVPSPKNIQVSIIHSIFIKGDTTNFDLEESDIEASVLYPNLKITTVDELLDIFLYNPPKPASTPFE